MTVTVHSAAFTFFSRLSGGTLLNLGNQQGFYMIIFLMIFSFRSAVLAFRSQGFIGVAYSLCGDDDDHDDDDICLSVSVSVPPS